MKINQVDACRLYYEGGFYDTLTEKYITAQHLSDLDAPDNKKRVGMFYTGLSSDDYLKINADTERYLRMPIIRPYLVFSSIAEKMQIPPEMFYLMGFDGDKEFGVFLSYEESAEIRNNGYSKTIADAKDAFECYVRFCDLYWDFVKTKEAVEREFIMQWLAENSIDLID